MVEGVHASVALATVLGAITDVPPTNLAHKVIVVPIESDAFFLAGPLLGKSWIAWVFQRGAHPEPQTHEAHQREDDGASASCWHVMTERDHVYRIERAIVVQVNEQSEQLKGVGWALVPVAPHVFVPDLADYSN